MRAGPLWLEDPRPEDQGSSCRLELVLGGTWKQVEEFQRHRLLYAVCVSEGGCRQANGRGVFIHRGRSKEVRLCGCGRAKLETPAGFGPRWIRRSSQSWMRFARRRA